jgi:hypothetical protein
MLSHVVMSVIQVFPSFVVFEHGWKGGDGWNPLGEVVGPAQIC